MNTENKQSEIDKYHSTHYISFHEYHRASFRFGFDPDQSKVCGNESEALKYFEQEISQNRDRLIDAVDLSMEFISAVCLAGFSYTSIFSDFEEKVKYFDEVTIEDILDEHPNFKYDCDTFQEFIDKQKRKAKEISDCAFYFGESEISSKEFCVSFSIENNVMNIFAYESNKNSFYNQDFQHPDFDEDENNQNLIFTEEQINENVNIFLSYVRIHGDRRTGYYLA